MNTLQKHYTGLPKNFERLSEEVLAQVTGGNSAGKNSELDDLTAGSEVPEL